MPDTAGRPTIRSTTTTLGFPDGVAPTRLRELGREQLSRYPNAKVFEHRVETLAGSAEDGFSAHAEGHAWRGRVVVVATGVIDHYPRFDGWEACVGRSLYWCIACDGYENRGRSALVVGHTDDAAAEALQLQALTDRIRLLTNSPTDEISDAFRQRLTAAKIPVVDDRIDAVSCADGMITRVHTKGGLELDAEAVFSIQGATPQTALAEQLGVALAATGWIRVDSEQKTNRPGVFAAGDVTSLHSHQVPAAVHEGAQAASAANYFLYPPRMRL